MNSPISQICHPTQSQERQQAGAEKNSYSHQAAQCQEEKIQRGGNYELLIIPQVASQIPCVDPMR